jgi:hypothetical protein
MKNARKSTIQEATAGYEAWLGELLPLIPEDLERKHEEMRRAVFPFLRATYYRWAQLWPQVCKDLRGARVVLAIGDLHVENFGTWRDAEGRLVWGVNDFDEASRLPYTNDLVRLAASAHLAVAEGGLALSADEACAAILKGYKEGLEADGQPFVLAERWGALRRMATERLKNPETFWEKLAAQQGIAADQVPASAVRALGDVLPMSGKPLVPLYIHRIAGLGALGRQRFAAVVEWCGGKIAREAKALAPSAAAWAGRGEGEARDVIRGIVGKAVRCQDPFFAVKRRWIVRRLAPDCSRIELAQLPKTKDSVRLLHAMGWETANIHLGSASAPALLLDLVSRPQGWLHEAAQAMRDAVQEDWEAWREAPVLEKEPSATPGKKGRKKDHPRS